MRGSARWAVIGLVCAGVAHSAPARAGAPAQPERPDLSHRPAPPARPERPDLSHRPAVPPARSWSPPVPTDTRASGVRIVVLPQHALPLVHVSVAVQAGSELDPPDKPGLAALTARLLEEGGAGARSGHELAQAFDELGGELRVDVSEAGAVFGVTVLEPQLDAALALLADVVARPRLDATEWPQVRARQLADLQRERDNPPHIADTVFAQVLFGARPYGHAPLGTRRSLEALTLADAQAFYQKHYGPRVTSIVIVGDTSLARASASLAAALAGKTAWNGRATALDAPPDPPETEARFVLIDRPGAPQSEVRVGRLGIAWSSPELPAASLLEMVLGGSFTSRLVQNLREKHGYTYGARAEFRLLRAPGPFVAGAAIRTDATADAMRELFHELGGMRAPLADGELKKARALLRQDLVDRFAEGGRAAWLLTDLVLNDQPLDAYARLVDALGRLDGPAISRVADKLFPDGPWVVVIVGDRKAIEPKLRALPMAKTIELRDVDGEPIR